MVPSKIMDKMGLLFYQVVSKKKKKKRKIHYGPDALDGMCMHITLEKGQICLKSK